MNYKCNLYTDWIELIRHELNSNLGITEPVSDEELILKYLNFDLRLPKAKQRKYHQSKNFVCPNSLLRGYSKLKHAVKNGESLYSFLSKGIKKSEYNDMLLNDWGIIHFHLGDTVDSKDPDFASRTGPLLFAFVNDDDFYAIGIYPHGSWTEIKILEDLKFNWPELIEPYKVDDASFAFDHTNDERKQLRKIGVNAVVTLPDRSMYLPPGGGFANSGINTNLVIKKDLFTKSFHNWTEWIKSNPEEISSKLISLGASSDETVDVSLAEIDGSYAIFFSKYKYAIPLLLKHRSF